MANDTKMLQAIINGQKALEERLSEKIDKVDKKVGVLEKKIDEGFEKVNRRLDKQGAQLAYLEDDAPTIREFDKLGKRVAKLESVVYKQL